MSAEPTKRPDQAIPLAFVCPACGANPTRPCFDQPLYPWRDSRDIERDSYHSERVDAAFRALCKRIAALEAERG